jgi:hypothetical protein
MTGYEYGYYLGVGILIVCLFLIPTIFFLITQQKTLKSIQPNNRLMEPGMVWLQLIPLFGIVWQFIVVSRISDSLKNEFNSWANDNSILGDTESLNLTNGRPTYDIGLAYCILFCCSIIPFLGFFASIAGLVCWILYWVKLSEFKNKITRRGF